jgi:hypothetical protein
VYAQSSLAEATTPDALVLMDIAASVSNIGFVDKDLDDGELGGRISWSPPGPEESVVAYRAYLTVSAAGSSRSLIGEGDVPVGNNELHMPAKTPTASFLHIVVYTRSVLVEQTTPVPFRFEDRVDFVTNVSFPDFDLDETELGGLLLWESPEDTAQVTHYVVYLGSLAERVNGALVCGNVSTPNSYSVTGVMTLSVPDSSSFVNSPAALGAILSTLANVTGQPVSSITVASMTATVRRLEGLTDISSSRRLFAGVVSVFYSINVPSSSAATAVFTTIQSTSTTYLTAILNEELAEVGLSTWTVTVNGISAE